jgi:exopolysaccharide biosynthesis polyprenyl glycosylphosphotransferase
MSEGPSNPSVALPVVAATETHVAAGHPSVLAGRPARRDFIMRRLLAGADAAGIVVALAVASALQPAGHVGHLLELGLLTVPAWIVLFKLYGLYERDGKRVSHATLDDLPWLFHAVVIGTLLSWVFFKLASGGSWPVWSVASFGFTTVLSILCLRSFARNRRVQLLGPERVLVVGEEEITRVLLRKMRGHPEYGLEPVGVATADAGAGGRLALPVLGTPADVSEIAALHRIDRVVLSNPEIEHGSALEIVRDCKGLGIKVSILPHVFDALGPSVEVDDVEGVTLLGINPPVLGRSSRMLKRCLDVLASGVLVLVTAPLWLVIALAIKVDSPGPVLFRQRRVGKGGKQFHLLKFRTMLLDAEDRRSELLKDSLDSNWLHLENDPRITRVGGWLRSRSLDELPQLWNVLRGEMSLVGPRPLIEAEDDMIGGWGRSRLDLTPGISGSWQVLGRTNIPFDEMVKLDYLYVTNWSLWRDIRLLVQTLPAVLRQRGAN